MSDRDACAARVACLYSEKARRLRQGNARLHHDPKDDTLFEVRR